MYELEHQIDAHLGLSPMQRKAADGIRLAVATMRRTEALFSDPRFIEAHGYAMALGGGSREDLRAAANTIVRGWLRSGDADSDSDSDGPLPVAIQIGNARTIGYLRVATEAQLDDGRKPA